MLRWTMILILMTMTSVAAADELTELTVDLPRLVYGASKYQQDVSRAPASVTIITADEIHKYGYQTLGDVLSSTAGLYVTNDRNYSFLGMRGFARSGDFNTGVLLLIDGHRINDATYNLMYVAQEALLDVEMIDRVEVIRGPSSSIYGNSAFFGVINIITRRAGDLHGVEAGAEVGSLDTYRAVVNAGQRFANGVEAVFSAAGYDSGGKNRIFYPEYADPDHNNGYAEHSDDETAYRFFSRLSYGDFTLAGAFSHRYKKVPAAPSETAFNSGLGKTEDDRGYLAVRYEHDLTASRKILGTLSYDWYPYRAIYPYENDAPPPELILNRDEATGEWARAEVQLTQRLLDRHMLIFGVDYQRNLRLHQFNADEDPFVGYLDVTHHGESAALYAQGEFALAKALLLNAGLRYDHFSAFGSTTNPRVGLIYTPRPGSTLKALYGEAFRAPNDYELNYQSATFERNPNLKPEAIRTYELVYEQALAQRLRFSVAGYHYSIEGLITENTNPLTGLRRFSNTDQVRANGLELQIDGRWLNNAQWRGSYALQRAEERATGATLTNSPRQLGRINLSVPLYLQRLFASVELQYQSHVIAPAGTQVNDFWVTNLTLWEQWRARGPTLTASVHNLFDRPFEVAGSGNTLQDRLPQNGRTWMLGISVGLN